nr:MAG TPA_asm: hypothetical protein [Caudoviricetes sp.]
MSDKKYQFELTENQAELINRLIGFKIRETVAWDAKEYEDTLKLSKDINRQIGYYQGLEKTKKVENED